MNRQNVMPVISAENDGAQELEKYLLWQADELAEIFRIEPETQKEKLEFLLRSSEKMKEELTNLEISWDKCIPMLHEGVLLCHACVEGKAARDKMKKVSSALVNSMVFLARSGGFRKRMVGSLNHRIGIIREVINMKYSNPEVSDL